MSQPLAEPSRQNRSRKPTKQQRQSPLIVKDGVVKKASDENLLYEKVEQEAGPVHHFVVRFENDPVWDTIADAIQSCSEDVELQEQDRDK